MALSASMLASRFSALQVLKTSHRHKNSGAYSGIRDYRSDCVTDRSIRRNGTFKSSAIKALSHDTLTMPPSLL